MPRWLAIVIVLVGTLAIVTGLLWLAVWQITQQWSSVQGRTVEAIDQFRQYLINGPLGLTHRADRRLPRPGGQTFIQTQAQVVLSGALAIGTDPRPRRRPERLLSLFILLCILADGAGIWRWTVRLFPQRSRIAVDGAGRAGWVTVINYARTQLLVATIDAIGIALGAFFLGVPLAIPIGVLVFLGSFVPIVGAVVTGTVAVFLALVYNGPWIALWMLVVVLGVQQLEGHVLQPLLMGSAVKVHPLAVVLVVAGGALIAGIPGALFAVPLAAFVNVVDGLPRQQGLADRTASAPCRSHLEHRPTPEEDPRVSNPSTTSVSSHERSAAPTLADFEDAAASLRGVITRTPVDGSQHLSDLLGVPVHLKLENLQRTGSFKIRGATYRLSRLTAEERARGVVAASAGNHAQGVALAAKSSASRPRSSCRWGCRCPSSSRREDMGRMSSSRARRSRRRCGSRPSSPSAPVRSSSTRSITPT